MTDSNQKKLLRMRVPSRTMHNLRLIEAACVNALAGEQEYPGGMAEFQSRVDPAFVLELVRIARSAPSDEELQELGRLLEEMTRYVKLVPDEKGAATPIERDALILRARQLRSAVGI